ncbi:hypothetical protein RQM65_02810 [Pricia sp. S334]|uniref:CYTH domain-containing protein n=1 Tax=Pricia mediterranea TaxID=3076079 RepID=A0ABU3L1V8_9FLAO|nr:hypothetical protein [Pricia sp. S334]MDT7827595.1 hypothetical protein [Pricia sp. S334]
MIKTKEVRWFFKEDKKAIRSWFESQGMDLFHQREDLYLQLDSENVGVKLREGLVEIKHRVGNRARGQLICDKSGYFEKYIKWSLNADEHDPTVAEILQGDMERWVSVNKARWAVLIVENNGELEQRPLTYEADCGYQIEYTKVHVYDCEWYTFGVEWFGNRLLEPDTAMMSDIIEDTTLNMKDSLGYAEFLKRLNPERKGCQVLEETVHNGF